MATSSSNLSILQKLEEVFNALVEYSKSCTPSGREPNHQQQRQKKQANALEHLEAISQIVKILPDAVGDSSTPLEVSTCDYSIQLLHMLCEIFLSLLAQIVASNDNKEAENPSTTAEMDEIIKIVCQSITSLSRHSLYFREHIALITASTSTATSSCADLIIALLLHTLSNDQVANDEDTLVSIIHTLSGLTFQQQYRSSTSSPPKLSPSQVQQLCQSILTVFTQYPTNLRLIEVSGQLLTNISFKGGLNAIDNKVSLSLYHHLLSLLQTHSRNSVDIVVRICNVFGNVAHDDFSLWNKLVSGYVNNDINATTNTLAHKSVQLAQFLFQLLSHYQSDVEVVTLLTNFINNLTFGTSENSDNQSEGDHVLGFTKTFGQIEGLRNLLISLLSCHRQSRFTVKHLCLTISNISIDVESFHATVFPALCRPTPNGKDGTKGESSIPLVIELIRLYQTDPLLLYEIGCMLVAVLWKALHTTNEGMKSVICELANSEGFPLLLLQIIGNNGGNPSIVGEWNKIVQYLIQGTVKVDEDDEDSEDDDICEFAQVYGSHADCSSLYIELLSHYQEHDDVCSILCTTIGYLLAYVDSFKQQFSNAKIVSPTMIQTMIDNVLGKSGSNSNKKRQGKGKKAINDNTTKKMKAITKKKLVTKTKK